ncbi:MAG: hypothetical protein EXR95_04575 [Gemmatimonadetes bacterium]|nr:hypothetical protein [Gemmatimonadota bacterium]
MATRKTPARAKGAPAPPALAFSRINLVLGAAGLIALFLGYLLLSKGSITAAPILLVLGYVVLVPLALIL